jgi:hypothetical protein
MRVWKVLWFSKCIRFVLFVWCCVVMFFLFGRYILRDVLLGQGSSLVGEMMTQHCAVVVRVTWRRFIWNILCFVDREMHVFVMGNTAWSYFASSGLKVLSTTTCTAILWSTCLCEVEFRVSIKHNYIKFVFDGLSSCCGPHSIVQLCPSIACLLSAVSAIRGSLWLGKIRKLNK